MRTGRIPMGAMMAEMVGGCLMAAFTGETPDIVQETLKPERIMENGRATIFFWKDGTKTIVKLQKGDEPDIYGAYANAIAKKVFGSRTAFKAVIDDMLQVETKKGDSDGTIPTSAESISGNRTV